jgi:ribonucleoside-diphosphate reductase alpha chain
MMESQIETGTPYVLYKDAVNTKSNQQHLGTIQCGNLCTEVVEFTSPEEVAVCNLASLGLPMFVKDGSFDFDELHAVTKVITRNLNKVIDRNFYPAEEARRSNMRHRPIGLGVQGLADVFALLRMPFESDEAMALNEAIFETIYHASMEASVELATELGPHESYEGSPLSKGKLQCDLWGVMPSPRWDWVTLRENLAKHGARNSLLIAPMPTASTSQILGNSETFEAYMSNIFKRKTLAGEFIVINEHLVVALESRDLWSKEMRDAIIAANGSVQTIKEVPEDLKELFKTTWEIKQRRVIDMAAARGPWICQSQSMNIYIEDADFKKLSSMHFHAWSKGLKTGCYYLRSRPKAQTQQFTIAPTQKKAPVKCDGEVCTVCSA